MDPLKLNKALNTNKLTVQEGAEWLQYLKIRTDQEVAKRFPYYVNHGMYPIKACVKNGGEKNPKFILNHHTNGVVTSPAFYRFAQSKMASAHCIMERDGNILYLIDIKDMSFHAVNRNYNLAVARLFNLERGWINEVGLEHVGKGNVHLFPPAQLRASIVFQRNVVAVQPSIIGIKSHRAVSPITRAGDPGVFFLLPLVEHAIFNDVDLENPLYWLKQYEQNPIGFMNNSAKWIEQYGLTSRDEWALKRSKLKVSQKNILP